MKHVTDSVYRYALWILAIGAIIALVFVLVSPAESLVGGISSNIFAEIAGICLTVLLIQKYIERQDKKRWEGLRRLRLGEIRSLGLDFIGQADPKHWPHYPLSNISSQQFREMPIDKQQEMNTQAKRWWDGNVLPILTYQELGPDFLELVTSSIDSYAQAFTIEEIRRLHTLRNHLKSVLRFHHDSAYIETHSRLDQDLGGWFNALLSNYNHRLEQLKGSFRSLQEL